MTDRELMQQALDLLDDINQCSLPPTGIPLPAEIDHVMEALRTRLAQPEPEPVAWVENLTDAQPHAVTDLKYCSVAQHERGEHLKYIPLHADPTPCQTCEALARTVMMDQTSHDTAPPQRNWQGLTDEEINKISDEWRETPNGLIALSRAIEAKLKEKNNG